MSDTPAAVSISQEDAALLAKYKREERLSGLGLSMDYEKTKASKDEYQQGACCKVIFDTYDMVRVASGDYYYYRDKDDWESSYRRLSDRNIKNIVREAYGYLGIPITATKVKSTSDTLKESVMDEVDNVDLSIIEIAPGVFWDARRGVVTGNPERPCFTQLFDNTGFEALGDTSISFKDIEPTLVQQWYKNALAILEDMEGDLPDPSEAAAYETLPDSHVCPTFDFIWTWSCERHGVYMDILKMIASAFMYKKPLGAFILTGIRRNGKSTCVKMLHKMFGRANTSSVRLSELSDPHKNLTLSTSMFNAPDEETEGKDLSPEAVSNFKTMAAHEPLLLPVLYETKPQWVQTNFISVSPMNSQPEWKGDSASACVQRSLIIPFQADLSQFDNGGVNFEQDTFTPAMYTSLIGTALAIATYYTGRKLVFSDYMNEAREVIAADTDNRVEYATLFNKYFIGYKRSGDVFEDYKAWCKTKGYRYVTMKHLMFAIHEKGGGVHRTTLRENGDAFAVYRLGEKKNGNYFHNEHFIYELGRTVGETIYIDPNADELVSRDGSVIDALERVFDQRERDFSNLGKKEEEDGE